MRESLLTDQLAFRREPHRHSQLEHAVSLLKPGYTPEQQAAYECSVAEAGLVEVYTGTYLFNYSSTLALYNDIFRFSPNDLLFGVGWKMRKLEYMMSDQSRISVVRGVGAQAACEDFKHAIRGKYGKLSVPSRTLSNEEFDDLAIKNIIHVVDASETEVALLLLVSQ